MEVEYFISTDGSCPPRGNRRVPAAADGWISQLVRESAAIRQRAEMAPGVEDTLSPIVQLDSLRVPTLNPSASSQHAFRASLALPTQVVLPNIAQEISPINCCPTSLLSKHFPLEERLQLSHQSPHEVPGENQFWSLVEDRALLHLDSSFQALTEGYLSLQQKFPQLFTKTTDEWISLRQLQEQQRRDVGDFSKDAVDSSDSDALRLKNTRQVVDDLFPRGSDFSPSDAVFKRRLQEIKSNSSRHKLLLSLPEDPTIFIPQCQEDDTRLLVPQPKTREASLEERREALRQAIFGGKVDSKEARALLDVSLPNSFVACDGESVPCNSNLLMAASPYFEQQFTSLSAGFRLDSNDSFWGNMRLAEVFSSKNVRKFVALCQQPNLLPKVLELKSQRDALQKDAREQFDAFVRDVARRRDLSQEALKKEESNRLHSTVLLYKDMLAEDVNTLTRLYRQHVARELDQLISSYDSRRQRLETHFEEELGYLELAKQHFLPTDLIAVSERADIVDTIVRKDLISQDDLPALLRLAEAMLASGVRTQLLQAIASSTLSYGSLLKLFSEGISQSTTSEFLSLLSDAQFFGLFESARGGDADCMSHFCEHSPLPVTADEPRLVSLLRAEWSSRLEARRQEVMRMSMADVSSILEQIWSHKAGRGPPSEYTLWESLFTSAVSGRHNGGADRLIYLREGGGKGNIACVSSGIFDISLCTSGLPLVIATIPSVRVGESNTVVSFESEITSAFLPEVFPYSICLGFEPVERCLNHVQLALVKEHASGDANCQSRLSREFRDENNTSRFFGPAQSEWSGPNSSLPGLRPTNVSATSEKLFVNGCGWSGDGLLHVDGASFCVQDGYSVGDVVGVSLNLLSGEVGWYKNGKQMQFTNFSSGKGVTILLKSLVAFKPLVCLQSTAMRNPVLCEDVMDGVIESLLESIGAPNTLTAQSRPTLSQLELLSLRLNLSDPVSVRSSDSGPRTGRRSLGLAQFWGM